MTTNEKEMVNELKTQWKKLWNERIDDKIRAEGIATQDYSILFVDKGTIIHATRDFKALNFKEILNQHQIKNSEKYIPPTPLVGGWSKFIKTSIRKQSPHESNRAKIYRQEKTEKQQPKKGGRGWLHK